MKMRMLNEEQAWRKIGWIFGGYCSWDALQLGGLCRQIYALCVNDKISLGTTWRMGRKVTRYRTRHRLSTYGYIWPLDDFGAKQRVAFCHRAAEGCKRARMNKRGKK